MKKILCMLLAACILLTAAGCNGGETPSDSADSSGKAWPTKSPSQESETAAPVDPAQIDGSKVLFQYSTVTPDWKVFEDLDSWRDYSIAEDEQGVLHLIYTDGDSEPSGAYHRFLKPDGSWSEPRLMLKLDSFDAKFLKYWVGNTPDGSMCFVWKECISVYSGRYSTGTDILHMMTYRDGEWREASQTYEYWDGKSDYAPTMDWFQIQFDAQGNLHCLYWSPGDIDTPGSGGLFLDGRQLIAATIMTEDQEPVVQGVGNLVNDSRKEIYFYIDSGDVWHLMGLDKDYAPPGSYPGEYFRYLHSYSRDGGETWEGPSAVFDNNEHIYLVDFAGDSDGNLHLMAHYFTSHLEIVTLRPDRYEPAPPEKYFSDEQISEGNASSQTGAKTHSRFDFTSVFLDSKGKLHYIARSGGMPIPQLDVTQIKGNAWAVREIDKPEGTHWIEISNIFPRRGGNFFLLVKDSESPEKLLYYAEIPEQ